MHHKLRLILLSISLSILLIIIFSMSPTIPVGQAQSPPVQDTPLGTAFTYQGFLVFRDTYYNGSCDFQFTVFNAGSGGAPLTDPIERVNVPIRNGYFTVQLDFGQNIFNGTKRWLAIAVRCNTQDGFVTLEPRQELTPTPYALALPGLWTQPAPADGVVATSPNLIGGYFGNTISAGVQGATIGGGGNALPEVDVVEPFPDLADGVIPYNPTQRVTQAYGTVSGGLGNSAALLATVGGGAVNTAGGPGAVVSGGGVNTADGLGAVVSGGYRNVTGGAYGVIGGGSHNTAAFTGTTVSGGEYNTASAYWSAIGGGADNTASGDGATVAGGGHNLAEGFGATVGGGERNTASISELDIPDSEGRYATVPGGFQNGAYGNYSFAAGRQAKAIYQGAFVWGDATAADLSSTAENQFIVRASGGIWLGTDSAPNLPTDRFINTSTGAYLSSSGTWTNSSDRTAKENISRVDGREVLDRLAGLPISTWNYKVDPISIRHMGPMAQDFYAAFELGNDETGIATIDSDGVALAAIQGLYDLAQRQEGLITALEGQNDDLASRVAALETLIESLTDAQAGGGR